MLPDPNLHDTVLQNPYNPSEAAPEEGRKRQPHLTEHDSHDTDVTGSSTHQFASNNSINTTQVTVPNSTISDVHHYSKYRFGWKCISWKCLEVFNKPVVFLICICVAGAAEGLLLTGISFSVLTSIEKHFGFTSSEVAFFTTIYELAYGVCGAFVGYVCHRHKPRCIAVGLMIMSIGAVIIAIPKFIIGRYEAGIERVSDFCNTGNNEGTCNESQDWYYQFLFLLGYVFLGIGATPLFVLTPAHIDEVTNRAQSSLYMGAFYCFCAIGPAIGFIIGMPVLDLWVDLKQPPNSSLTPTDTNWVGAWWIGYLIAAVVILLPVVPLFGLPKEFPSTKTIRDLKHLHEDTLVEDRNLRHDFKSVFPAIKALFTKLPFLFLTLAISSESLAIGGYATFLPKFIHTQFHITASRSALYTGIIVIPGAAGGIFLGGYVVKRFSLKCKQILKLATVMAFISAFFCAITLVGCNGRKVVGQRDKSTGTLQDFTTDCNDDCSCNRKLYKPICSVEDQKTYYSPCHAGCYHNETIHKVFYNCTCFSNSTTHAVDGQCTEECTLFPLFAIGAIILMFFTFMNNVPMVMATLRVVHEGQGSFAIGIQQTIVRFLGFIPAPVMFGALIDKSCGVWGIDGCGERTHCLEYDQQYFRYYMFTLGIVTKFVSFVFILLAYKCYRLPKIRTPSPSSQAAVIYADVIENENVSTDL